MALSLCLRASANSSVLSNVLRNTNIVSRLAGNYSPLQAAFKKSSNLLQHANQVNKTPTARTLMSPSAHWTIERVLSISLFGAIPMAILNPCTPILDHIAVTGMVLHSHWGLEAVVIDYIRPVLFGNVIPLLARAALHLISFMVLGSLLYFNVNDVGFGRAVLDIWNIEPKTEKVDKS